METPNDQSFAAPQKIHRSSHSSRIVLLVVLVLIIGLAIGAVSFGPGLLKKYQSMAKATPESSSVPVATIPPIVQEQITSLNQTILPEIVANTSQYYNRTAPKDKIQTYTGSGTLAQNQGYTHLIQYLKDQPVYWQYGRYTDLKTTDLNPTTLQQLYIKLFKLMPQSQFTCPTTKSATQSAGLSLDQSVCYATWYDSNGNAFVTTVTPQPGQGAIVLTCYYDKSYTAVSSKPTQCQPILETE